MEEAERGLFRPASYQVQLEGSRVERSWQGKCLPNKIAQTQRKPAAMFLKKKNPSYCPGTNPPVVTI